MSNRIKAARKKLKGSIDLPASKSISNRLLLISGLSGGRVELSHLSESEDTTIMNQALRSREKEINIGHAGTAMRFLTAGFSLLPGERVLTGSERMKKRPIGKLVQALQELGADIHYLGEEGYPPLRIRGKQLPGNRCNIDGSTSSQYISALLMIAPVLPQGLTLELTGTIISASYIRLTLDLMKQAGIQSHWDGNTISVPAQNYNSAKIVCEPDWSSASYIYQMAALADSADLFMPGLKAESLQGDAATQKLFHQLGVVSEFGPFGLRIKKKGDTVDLLEYDFLECPDIVQTLAVTCVLKKVAFRFSGTQSLRIKETDRIAALQNELAKFGAHLEYSPEGILQWNGEIKPSPLPHSISTYQDHRMAMAFAPAALLYKDIEIEDPEVVKKSFPGFWKEIDKLGIKIL